MSDRSDCFCILPTCLFTSLILLMGWAVFLSGQYNLYIYYRLQLMKIKTRKFREKSIKKKKKKKPTGWHGHEILMLQKVFISDKKEGRSRHWKELSAVTQSVAETKKKKTGLPCYCSTHIHHPMSAFFEILPTEDSAGIFRVCCQGRRS